MISAFGGKSDGPVAEPNAYLHSVGSISTVPLKCNPAFWPKGCLPRRPLTSKLTAKIMQNCEGEQKRSGSLIISCHGPLKIFSRQPGKEEKKKIVIILIGIHERE